MTTVSTEAKGKGLVPADYRLRRRTMGATCGAHVVHDGLADALYVLLPVWAGAFGLGYAAAGLLKSAYSVALAALQMPTGMLAERVGERTLLGTGTVLAGLAFALTALAPSYWVLIVLVLLTGIGSAVQHPVSSSLIAKAYDAGARRAALGVYNFSGDVGKMVAAALIGVGAALVGWRMMALAYGLLVIVMGAVVLRLISAMGAQDKFASTHVPLGERHGNPLPISGFGLTDARGYILLSSIQVIDSATRVGVLTLVPFLLISKGATPATAGLALSFLFAGGAAGKLACGLMADRLGVLRTVILTEVMTAVLIAATIVEPLRVAIFTLPLMGIVLNGTSSVLYGTVADFVHPDRQARAFGLFYSLGSAAGASAPVVFGLVSDYAGLVWALLSVAVSVLITLPLAFALRLCVSERVI
jgi:MFS family permease